MKKIDIIILCGGLGTRIKSKSKNLPKILIEIQNKKPFILWLLKKLYSKRLNRIILSVGYRKQKLINFVKNNKNLDLSYCAENTQLGTGGAIKNAIKKKNISDPFIVVNGDTYFNFNIDIMINKYFSIKKNSFIMLKKSEKEKRYDQFAIINNKITKLEKKSKMNKFINAGLYLFHKRDFNIKKNKFSIENIVIPNLIKNNQLSYFINKSKIFYDIGVPNSLRNFKNFIKKK
tara:strand:- start:2763 stop:3458 length:696 start_codon:yes stop_codon:yes gene_type:complete